MTIRLVGALLCGAVCAASFAVSATPSYAGEPIPGVDIYLGKDGRSSKARATTVKSSKSNTSDRMGGGAGKGRPAYLNPQPEPPGKAKIRR
jgi:hypothetical protein